MKPQVIDMFRKYDVGEPGAAALVKEVKEDILSRKHVVALEIAYRKKMITDGGKCARCGREDMLTTDHIVPKAILLVMGVDVERTFMPKNLMLLCRPCNSIKSDRLDFSFPQTKQILLKLLERL
jgi:5-methylcytosine-specific restriction endonuclease McrA